MNLSEWGATPVIRSEGERGQRQADAQEISDAILGGQMPPDQYLILHPNADLSQAEREQLAKGFQSMLGVAAKIKIQDYLLLWTKHRLSGKISLRIGL